MIVMNFFVNIYLVDWEVTKHKPPNKGYTPKQRTETYVSKCLLQWQIQDF